MRKVTYGAGCSLDGYIADPHDGVAWLRWSAAVQALSAAYWQTIDTVLMGRRTYEVAVSAGIAAYAGVRNVVFSRTLGAAPDASVEIVRQDAAEFVRPLKEAEGAGICVMGGGLLATSLLAAGLIDEVGVNLHPILLGSGIPLFSPPFPRVRLELIRSQPLAGGCMYQLYRVAGLLAPPAVLAR